MILTNSVRIISPGTELKNYNRIQFPYTVALTFDDGPYPGYTEKLIKLLEMKNIKATFFVIGKHAESHPELIKLIDSGGHEIGGHTYSHRNLTKLKNQEIINDIELTNNIIRNIINKNTYLIRPPGGKINKRVREVITKSGYKIILWTVLPKDHDFRTTKEKIVTYTINETTNFGIILLHQGIQKTLDALPEIIDTLRARRYNFVTVSELLAEKEKLLLTQRFVEPSY